MENRWGLLVYFIKPWMLKSSSDRQMKGVPRICAERGIDEPVFLVVAKMDPLRGWLFSDNGYAVLHPLFVLLGAIGVAVIRALRRACCSR